MGYRITNKKIKAFTFFGISHYILKDAFLRSNQNTLSNRSAFNDSNLSLNFGLGLQTKLNKRFSANLEPVFKYHLLPVSKEVNFSVFTTSVLLGVEYKF